MYQHLITTRILFAIGIGLLIFSLVFGWVAFAVPDWLQYYERSNLTDPTVADNDLKKFGLWYYCIFLTKSNDFICTSWKNNTPTFVRVAQVLIPIGLAFSCLSFISACCAFICTRSYITTVLFAALFAFLSFVFTIIGVTVFANESLIYVERFKIEENGSSRRWGMWLLIPYLILSFATALFFVISTLLNWCDYRRAQVSGILNHSVGKYNGSVDKFPSDNNTTTAFKKQFPYLDYPNGYYQINGLNNNPQNQFAYPPPPGYPSAPGGAFGYSRPGTPTMNPMYPYSNHDSYHHRNYMTENSEMDAYSRSSRPRQPPYSRSRHRSRSSSPAESTNDTNVPQQTQFIPIPVPYYQPQAQSQPTSNINGKPISYVIPQAKQQYLDESNPSAAKTTNLVRYNAAQPTVMVSNPSQPLYTIAYRANNGGNVFTGPATTTYVTAGRNPIGNMNVSMSDSENEEALKEININETWA